MFIISSNTEILYFTKPNYTGQTFLPFLLPTPLQDIYLTKEKHYRVLDLIVCIKAFKYPN